MKIACFCLIMILFASNGFPQDSIKTDRQVSYSSNAEKIYVHFDKPYYNPGETVWFKAYILTGIEPETLSRNFYAEMTDVSGKVHHRLVAPIMESSASGSFTLADSSGIGPYIFSAYTLSMIKSDSSGIFKRQIPVIGEQNNLTTTDSVSIRFFPESGNMVYGIESRVGFKMEKGKLPVNGSGEIIGEDGKKITDFEVMHNGMGTFTFTPVKGRYRARWKSVDGSSGIMELPAIQQRGVVLSANLINNTVHFSVRGAGNPNTVQTMYIRGSMDHQVLYSARLTLGNDVVTGQFPDSIAVSGIMQLTLLDINQKPVAERIIFIHRDDYRFEPTVDIESFSVQRRGKNELQFSMAGDIKQNLSMTVTAMEAVNRNPLNDNIISYLMLSGELRGYIHEPGYYFSGAEDALQKLDLVMLTHGWRKYSGYNPKSIRSSGYNLSREEYLQFSGKINNIPPGNIPEGQLMNVIVQYKDTSIQFLEIPIDQDGRFTIRGLAFYDTATFYYSFNKNRAFNNRATITVNDNLYKGQRYISKAWNEMPEFSIANSVQQQNAMLREQYLAATQRRNRQYKILETVTVQARIKSEQDRLDEKYSRGMFRGGESRNFDLVNDPLSNSYFNIFQYLQGRVAGLQIINGFGNPSLRWRGGTPGLFLNEMRVDATMLSTIPITDVAYIKVFRPPFMGAFSGGSGAIAVYTRRGDERQATIPGGLSKIEVAGYTPVKEFYSPDYASSSPLHELEDLRTTLYWNPYIILDSENKTENIIFYNNDYSKKLQVIIEGVDGSGRIGRKVLVLE